MLTAPLAPKARLDRPTRLLLAVTAVYVFVRTALASPARLATQAFDDACYFARIAENVARGYGFTFDRINPTNGYQPMWEYLLIPVQALPLPPEQRFVIGMLLQVAMLALASALLFRTLVRLLPGTSLLPAAALFVTFVFLESVNGMETATQVLALAMLVWAGWRWEVFALARPLPSFGLGVILGAALLARLDGIFNVFALGGVALVAALRARERRAERLRGLSAIALGTLVAMAPYLAYNRMVFGAFVPISGLLKSSFPHAALHGGLLARFGVRGVAHLALGLGFVLHYLAGLPREGDRPAGQRYLRAAILVGALGMFGQATYALLFMKWATFRWHFVWFAIVSTLIVAEATRAWLARAVERSAWRAAPVLAGGLLALAVAAQTVRADLRTPAYNWHRAAYDAAIWARTHVPEDAVLAMNDAGTFGYFSGRRVINLDGVVNTLGYQDTIREQRWVDYLHSRGVTYIVKHDFGDIDYDDRVDIGTYRSVSYRVLSHRFDVWSDRTWLYRDDEVFRTREFRDQDKTVVAALWRWDGRKP